MLRVPPDAWRRCRRSACATRSQMASCTSKTRGPGGVEAGRSRPPSRRPPTAGARWPAAASATCCSVPSTTQSTSRVAARLQRVAAGLRRSGAPSRTIAPPAAAASTAAQSGCPPCRAHQQVALVGRSVARRAAPRACVRWRGRSVASDAHVTALCRAVTSAVKRKPRRGSVRISRADSSPSARRSAGDQLAEVVFLDHQARPQRCISSRLSISSTGPARQTGRAR